MKRPTIIHYAGASKYGLAFECYRRELRRVVAQHQEVKKRAKNWMEEHSLIKMEGDSYPKRHTSLDKVTCLECWQEIMRLAKEVLR